MNNVIGNKFIPGLVIALFTALSVATTGQAASKLWETYTVKPPEVKPIATTTPEISTASPIPTVEPTVKPIVRPTPSPSPKPTLKPATPRVMSSPSPRPSASFKPTTAGELKSVYLEDDEDENEEVETKEQEHEQESQEFERE